MDYWLVVQGWSLKEHIAVIEGSVFFFFWFLGSYTCGVLQQRTWSKFWKVNCTLIEMHQMIDLPAIFMSISNNIY